MMPFNLLEVWPGDRIGIVNAQVGQVVVGHVFRCPARAHGAGIFEHGFVGCGEGGGGDGVDVGGGEFGVGEGGFVGVGGVVADVAGAGGGSQI